jgi:hypothetical protein
MRRIRKASHKKRGDDRSAPLPLTFAFRTCYVVAQVLVDEGTQTGAAWHLLVKVTFCESAASTPQERPVVGVQV